MFQIKLNLNLKSFLKELNENKLISSEEYTTLVEDQGYMSIHTLLELYKKQDGVKQYSIHQLLTPLEFQFKEKPTRGSSYTPEFKKQLELLRNNLKEREYQDMVKNEPLNSNNFNGNNNSRYDDDSQLTPAQMNKQIKEQVTTIFNILVSVVSVVFAIWYWSGSSSRFPVGIRILLCLFFGILVLVAEVVVYNGYLQKLNEAKVKERSKREKKRVVKTIKISGKSKPHQN